MNKTYKTLMALVAALLLVPSAFAQYEGHEKYIEYPNRQVGLNKYLVNNVPNADGEYILRLETFTTGTVSSYAVPTDFVLVLDNSGSMLEDCLFGKLRPDYVTADQMADPNDQYYQFLRPAHSPENLFLNRHCYSYSFGYNQGSPGENMYKSSNTATQANYNNQFARTTWSYFSSTEDSPSSSLYYYYAPDDTYYKIKRESVVESASTTRYYLYFDRKDDLGKKYIRSTSATTIVVSDTPSNTPTNDGASRILLVGFNGDGLYRPVTRMEELVPGYQAFIQSIYDHNQNDNWASGVTKHQVAVVSFSQQIAEGSVDNPSIAPPTGTLTYAQKHLTRVIKGFSEVSAANVGSYKSVISDYFSFLSGTQTFYGLRLATRLLQNLQMQPNMSPVNAAGQTVRNKVVILFTDGEPKEVLSNGNFPFTTQEVTSGAASRFYTVKYSLQEADIIQAKRTSPSGNEINGQIFALDFAGSAGAARYLQYLSSNYSGCDATLSGPLNEEKDEYGNLILAPIMDRISYTGTALTPDEARIYYMNANQSGALEQAFTSIADTHTGYSDSRLVAVDVLSDDFELPEGLTGDSEKIKLYTAQCIGTKNIDGQDYLAFAQPVQASSRGSLDEIWFYNSENADPWTKQENLDIDNGISCVITGKQLVFKGFDFANLWCGKDVITEHHNMQQVSSSDPNAAYQDPTYRGFKLIAEFPIVVADHALGGVDVPTNDYDHSGFFTSNDDGVPTGQAIVNYPKPALTVPIRLVIQKTGLKEGESASFTIQRKKIGGADDYTDFTSFVLTGIAGSNAPEVRLVSLDPTYYYRVKETGWSWAYENADPNFVPSTEDPNLVNPIQFRNDPKTDTPKHAEAKAVNKMRSWSASTTTTVYDLVK